MRGEQLIPPAISMAEAQAYARVETGEEEALLAGLVRSATAICEEFVGQALVARPFAETVPADGSWRRLAAGPVRSIGAVEMVAIDGSATPAASREVDIDSNGDGWVRVDAVGRARVSGEAGMASEPNGVPEPLRQGIARLVAHLYSTRDGSGGEPPAAVTALWRPYRRMRLK